MLDPQAVREALPRSAARREAHPRLARARSLVSAGDAQAAVPIATELLDEALDSGDFVLQGEALHCLAVLELRLLGRFDRAIELAECASLCFQRVEHVHGECAALATHAIASVRLGRHERAMESALLAVRLAEGIEDGPRLVLTYHALGVAAYSGRNFEESRNAFQRAIRQAHLCDPPLNVFELQVDLAFTECLLYFTERNFSGQRLALDALRRLVGDCRQLQEACPGNISLSPGSHANNVLVLQMTELLLEIWQERLDRARRLLEGLRETGRQYARPWMTAVEWWGEAEIALAQGCLDDAAVGAARMMEIALEHRHETLVGVAYQLAGWIAQQRGDAAGALQALKGLMRREQAARAESLKSRVKVIEWQLALRENRHEVEKLMGESRLFEKLAMEDPLTGLPNRRALEARLAREFSSGDPVAHCLVLVDVDRFKDINDRHSHQAGDEVLVAVAGAFRRHLREGDFCARLAGDEFVLYLRGGETTGESVCARIQADLVSGAPVRPGISVRLSMGLVQIRAGETPESALARADQSMYTLKAVRRGER